VGDSIEIDIEYTSEALRKLGVAGSFSGTWTPNDAERRAAWDLLVDLVTRVTVVPLADDDGRLDAALASFASVFEVGRNALRAHGPEVAIERSGEVSFAVLVAHLLNRVIRPVTAWWHPRVRGLDEEVSPSPMRTKQELRGVLRDLSELITEFAVVFAEACGAEEFVRFLVDEGMHFRRPSE
jgi:hypothetical protein